MQYSVFSLIFLRHFGVEFKCSISSSPESWPLTVKWHGTYCCEQFTYVLCRPLNHVWQTLIRLIYSGISTSGHYYCMQGFHFLIGSKISCTLTNQLFWPMRFKTKAIHEFAYVMLPTCVLSSSCMYLPLVLIGFISFVLPKRLAQVIPGFIFYKNY